LVVLSKNPAILIGGDAHQAMRMLLAAASRVPEVILKRRELSDRDWKLILKGVSTVCGRGHQILDSSKSHLLTREQTSGQLVAVLAQSSTGVPSRDELIRLAQTTGGAVVGSLQCDSNREPIPSGSLDILRLKGSMLNARVEGALMSPSPEHWYETCISLEHDSLSMWMAEEVEY
jgi:hypothetical protein